MHPDAITADIGAYRSLGRRLAVENMDARKDAGRTAGELEHYFTALPDARLCFDIAHLKAVDASLDEGRAILDRFASRLSHVHLSSLDDRHQHVPLTPEDRSLFSDLLSRCPDVPWILEAPPI
jgi:sugar phosphate isomerase/epimerase